jgi:chromosome segregation ATPase
MKRSSGSKTKGEDTFNLSGDRPDDHKQADRHDSKNSDEMVASCVEQRIDEGNSRDKREGNEMTVEENEKRKAEEEREGLEEKLKALQEKLKDEEEKRKASEEKLKDEEEKRKASEEKLKALEETLRMQEKFKPGKFASVFVCMN